MCGFFFSNDLLFFAPYKQESKEISEIHGRMAKDLAKTADAKRLCPYGLTVKALSKHDDDGFGFVKVMSCWGCGMVWFGVGMCKVRAVPSNNGRSTSSAYCVCFTSAPLSSRSEIANGITPVISATFSDALHLIDSMLALCKHSEQSTYPLYGHLR